MPFLLSYFLTKFNQLNHYAELNTEPLEPLEPLALISFQLFKRLRLALGLPKKLVKSKWKFGWQDHHIALNVAIGTIPLIVLIIIPRFPS